MDMRLVAAIFAVALVMTLGAASASAASSTSCRVQNTVTGKTYTALQAAVDAASRGDRLTVRGKCEGGVVIDRDLIIAGVRTMSTGDPTLAGAGNTSVVRIVRGSRVKLSDLVIRDGHARRPHEGFSVRRRGLLGGGITNRGTLTLRNVTVRDNVAEYGGGGIWNAGALTLNGSSSVSGNTSYFGGGVYHKKGRLILNGSSRISGNTARSGGEAGGGVYTRTVFPRYGSSSLTMNGTSRISDNTTGGYGGGVLNGLFVRITMNDESRISGNEASAGGGIYTYGWLTLNDRSAVSANRAADSGGGVANQHRLTMNDDSSVSANVALGYGGGIGNAANEIADLRDRSSVFGNSATSGGGVLNWGTLRMYGTSRVTGNTALGRVGDEPGGSLVPSGMGGGVFNSERLLLTGASSIDGNTAHDGGGGVAYFASHGSNVGLHCGPGGNVHDNSLGDCLSWP